ncbi:unnamed protein product [Orchesella dallaii]|uniref:C2H2-type domain-containing protein n=1 Tax=Orchesella dallaii TaxID=48710 RepID=A0ABP1QY03_9HEXA
MESSSWERLGDDDLSSSPPPVSDSLECTEKLRYCFICASGIQNNLNEDGEEQLVCASTEISLEVFLKGLDIFCEALQIDRKPFCRDEEWKRFAELDNFVRYICCSQCCSILENVVSLHELILSTEMRLKVHLHTIKNHVVDSSQRKNSDKIEYFDRSCIQFRKDVLKKFHKRLREPTDTQYRNVSPESVGEAVNPEILPTHSKAQPKAKRSKPFTRPPYEKESDSPKQILIKREKNDPRDSDDSQSFNHLDFSCEEDDTLTGNVENRDEFYSKRLNSDKDSDFECQEALESYSSASDDEDFIPYVKRRKTSKKDPLGSCEEPTPPNKTEASSVKRKRGRPRKSSERPVTVDRNSEQQPNTQDFQVPVKRKRGRPKKYPQWSACEATGRKPKVKESDNLQLAANDSIPLVSEDNIPIDIPTSNGHSTVNDSTSFSMIQGKRPKKMYQKMWRTKDFLLQHGPNARPISVLNSSTGEMSYLHVKILLQKPILYCKHPECNFSVNNVISFAEQEAFLEIKRHIRDKHRKCFRSSVSGAEGGYCCYYCDSTFSSRPALYDHSRSQHPNLKLPLSLCEICGKILQQKGMFLHVLRHKSDQEKSEVSKIRLRRTKWSGRPRIPPSYKKSEDGSIIEPPTEDVQTEFRCDECHKVYRGLHVFRRHQKTHLHVDLRKQFECDICHAKLASATSLMYHKDSVHAKTPYYTCSYCGRGFPRNQMTCYKTHVRLHTGERPYQCSICGNSFVSKQMLKIHELTHEDTQIQCEYCPNWYKNQVTLNRHQRNHHSESYAASIKKEKSGIVPKSIRLDQRPDFIGPRIAYPCEPCGKVFRWKSVLVAHMKTKHKLHLPNPDDYPNQNILQHARFAQSYPS